MSEMALELIRQAKKEGWKRLDLGYTGIVGAVPEEVGELEALEELVLSEKWMEWDGERWIRRESENNGPPNKITHLSAHPPQNLKILVISRTQVSDLTPVRNLTQLQELICFNTQVSDLTPVSNLTQLHTLHCSSTQVRDLTPVSKLTLLQILDCSGTKVSDLTPVSNLTQLHTLSCSYTQVSDLTPVSNLTQLQELRCYNTQVSDLTPVKTLIQKGIQVKWESWGLLKGIYVKDCPLTNPPVEIVKQGNTAILAYWKQQENENKTYINRELKLVLVGNSDAGKTSLRNYLVNGKLGTGHSSTHGMEVGTWSPNSLKKTTASNSKNSQLKVRILDFGGQEYYHDTHHLFFTENTAFALLWDKKSNVMGRVWVDQLSPKKTHKEPVELHQYPLQYWLGAIQHFCEPLEQNPANDELAAHSEKDKGEDLDRSERSEFIERRKEKSPLKGGLQEKEADAHATNPPSAQQFALVVQTKLDMDGVQFLPQTNLTERFPFIYDFCAVSLHPDSPMREEQLKDRLLEMLSKMPLLNKEFPGSTPIIRDEVEGYKEDQKVLTYIAFGEWANGKIQEKHKEITLLQDWVIALANYFAQIGLVLVFPHSDHPDLRDKVFLRPDLLTQQIYAVLDGLHATQGRFDRLAMKSALDNYLQENDQSPSTDQDLDHLILLMRQFKIIFREGGKEDQFVAPLYLPEQPQQGVQLFLDLFSKPAYRVQYPGFIHKSVILHFFEAFAPKVYSETSAGGGTHYYYWREGIVLKDPKYGAMILIKFFLGKENAENPGTYLPAYMDVIPLQQSPGEKAFLDEVMQSLRTINKGWHAEEMVTANGQDFVPLKKVQEAAQPLEPGGKPQFVFFHKEKPYLLRDFKDYVTLSMPMKKVFISYSKADTEHLRTLENHLSVFKRNGTIETWNCRKLIPGEKWDGKIQSELEEADIILFLVSADFLATDYIWDIEIKRAVQRQTETNGRVKVVPIIVRPCVWEDSPLGIFTSPEKAAPITLSSNTDEAWTKAVRALEKIFRDEASVGMGDKR